MAPPAPSLPIGWAIALALLSGGCGALYGYPDPLPERDEQQCADGVDNDLDGQVDCGDSECAAHCGENTEALCKDAADNDADDETDCEDSDCKSFCLEDTEETCHDGEDNDQDTLTDCRDSDCKSFCPEADASSCSDEEDNDLDGDTDCDDTDCEGFCPEETAADCSDELDNDGDGLLDMADPRCWLLQSPRIQRCAESQGIELSENFDIGIVASHVADPWKIYGTYVAGELYFDVVQGLSFLVPEWRTVAAFQFNTTASSTLDTNLASLVNGRAFAGHWEGMKLTFDASVPEGALLHAAIAPVELARFLEQPTSGAEVALFGVAIDAAHHPPTFDLYVEHNRFSAALPTTSALCNGTTICPDDKGEVTVVAEADGFRATLRRVGSDDVVVEAPLPSLPNLPPSQLVFSGGTTDPSIFAVLDDVRLSVPGDLPCGFSVPQVPGRSCDWAETTSALGYGVSLAGHAEDDYCALLTGSESTQVPAPKSLSTWRSADAEEWVEASKPSAPPVTLPEAASLVGAGIAADTQGYELVVAYDDGDNVRLGFASGTCEAFGKLTKGASLFPDAEAPSLVIGQGESQVYFTRPPIDDVHRTLWRVAGFDKGAEPELLAELPVHVGAPVSVQRVGRTDLVLIYPSEPGIGEPGVGVLVADASARTWQSVEPYPLLPAPDAGPTLNDLWFDSAGVVAAALGWNGAGGFLLYSGLHQTGWSGDSGLRSFLTTGSAKVVPSDATIEWVNAALPKRCGDGECDGAESCITCPADCACGGIDLVTDGLSSETTWSTVSESDAPDQIQVFDGDTLNFVGGDPTWSALELDQNIIGDFELSFDLVLRDVPRTECSAYVGVGVPGADAVAPSAGVFVKFGYSDYCTGRYRATPAVDVGGSIFGSPPERPDVTCWEGEYASRDVTKRIALRREGSKVTAFVERDDGCGAEGTTVTYSGATPELSTLLIGYGGGDYENCKEIRGAGHISKLRLRLLDDPNDCRGEAMVCGDDAQATCVDTSTSLEHCGACDRSCAAHETCDGGSCRCSDSPSVVDCDGVCADLQSSREHCGACDNACQAHCRAGVCDFFGGDCERPVELPADGGTFDVVFEAQTPSIDLCTRHFLAPIVFGWTPPMTGTATVELSAASAEGVNFDTFVVLSDDLTCTEWPACGSSRVTLDVKAGTTYRIVAGLASAPPAPLAGKLEVRVDP